MSPGDRALTVAISTIDESRLDDFDRRYPPGRDWKYLVLVQSAAQVSGVSTSTNGAGHSHRADVEVVHVDGVGVTKSRNAAINHTRSALLLFCDDDLVMQVLGLEKLISAFEADAELALLTGRTLGETGGFAKNYADQPERLTLFNSAKYGTVELAVRVDRIRHSRCAFDERFGAGAIYPLGDEFIFIADCIKQGLKCWYLPITIAVHLGDSSGQDWKSARHLRARALALRRVFGPLMSLPLIILFAVKHRRKFPNLGSLMTFLIQSITPA